MSCGFVWALLPITGDDMILTIEYDATVSVLEKVQKHIDWALKHNPDMNGVRLTIERGDYTSMSGDVEGHAAVTLFHDVQRIIENEKENSYVR